MPEERPIIIFDGVCNLCDAFTRRVIRHDPAARFRFAASQSEAGRALLLEYHEAPFANDTVVLIKNGVAYERGDAVLEILKELPRARVSRALYAALPKPARETLYRFVAKNRYRLFGQKEWCALPAPEIRDRFL